MEAGEPASYLTLEPGTPVLSSEGDEVGRVAQVLAEPAADIFDGILIDAHPGGRRYIDGAHVGEITAESVVLRIPAAEVDAQPERPGG